MDIFDFFRREGTVIAKGEGLVEMPRTSEYAWLILQGKASIFLTDLNEDEKTGSRHFLFEVGSKELIFGMVSAHAMEGIVLQAVASTGCEIMGLDVQRLAQLAEKERVPKQLTQLVHHWLGRITKGLQSTGDEIAATLEEAVLEEAISVEEYLKEPQKREYIHKKTLNLLKELWERQRQEELMQRRERKENDQRLLLNAIVQLATLNEKERKYVLPENSGNTLMDACRLVGQSMRIEITVPVLREGQELTIGGIARASHIRTREVSLNGTWYKRDSGPILAFMEEDGRPVALLPKAPGSYILHDPVESSPQRVDRQVASRIREQGLVFFRSFEQKKIGLKELLIFGIQSCWKQDLIRIIIMGIFGGLLGTAVPLATGIVFDRIIPEGDKGALLQIGLIICASALAGMLFQLTRALASQRMEGKMDGTLQAAVWDRLLSLPVPFFKQYSSGELAMRAMGVSQIRTILSGTTLNSILSGIFSVFTFAVLFYYDPGFAAVAALLVFLSILAMSFLAYQKVKYEQKVLAVSNRITGLMLQLIGSVTKFKVAGAQSRAFSRWAQEFAIQRRLTLRRESVSNLLAVYYTVFPVLSGLVIFYVQATSSTPLQSSQFVGFYAAFVSFMLSMVGLANSLIDANLVIPLYQRAKPILEALPEDDATKIAPGILTGAIEASHISFRYGADGSFVLKDISFCINEGDYVALVGTSGCGKSTLFRILLGFETPETGNIYYDSQDLSKVDVRAVRRQLGVVLQNGQLMTGSIFDNIIGTNPNLTMDDAWEAAAMAGIEEDIRDMPMGMHTVISEGASTISGGQKQRIMIARAIVNRPKIIYFDEATSALDNRTQAIVSRSLDALNSTRIVIAHRLSTIINCNKIIVMDKGRIAEQGTYRELMEKDGIFASLAKRQLE